MTTQDSNKVLDDIKFDIGKNYQKLDEIHSSIKGEDLFSFSTFKYIIIPSFVGAICAILISLYSFDSSNKAFSGSFRKNIAYIFVATILSSSITSYAVGIPNNSEKQTKTCVTSIALSLTLPTMLTYFNNMQKSIAFLKAENLSLRETKIEIVDNNVKFAKELSTYQKIVDNSNNYSNQQINLLNLSIDSTRSILMSTASNKIKEKSLLYTLRLIDNNSDGLANKEVFNNYSELTNNLDSNLINREVKILLDEISR